MLFHIRKSIRYNNRDMTLHVLLNHSIVLSNVDLKNSQITERWYIYVLPYWYALMRNYAPDIYEKGVVLCYAIVHRTVFLSVSDFQRLCPRISTKTGLVSKCKREVVISICLLCNTIKWECPHYFTFYSAFYILWYHLNLSWGSSHGVRDKRFKAVCALFHLGSDSIMCCNGDIKATMLYKVWLRLLQHAISVV